MKITLSIIYVYFNTPMEIINAVNSVKDAVGGLTHEIIIVNNASLKPLPKEIVKNKGIKIIKNSINIGYGRALNQGATIAKGEYLVLVNSDTVFEKDSLKYMLDKMKKDLKIGALGPRVVDVNGKTLQSYNKTPFLKRALFAFSFFNKIYPFNKISDDYHLSHLNEEEDHEVEVASGVCLMVRKCVFEKIKGFDGNFFMYFEEDDFCFRVRKTGYKVLYFPGAKVKHLVGKSMHDKKIIRKIFEESRFYFFKKYHGSVFAVTGELFLRFFTWENILLTCVLFTSLFLNLYKIDSLMMFQGDFGRDYLAARDMILTGEIPLVGIPSSVVWLHQGALSIYIIGIAFILGQFNPVTPAILYGIIGVFSTFLVYFLGKEIFNKKIGLLSAIFFATSPLVVVNSRMPYHTSPIPLFAGIFFLLLFKILKGKTTLFPLLFFVLGLLLQVELSNGVVFFILTILFLIYRPVFSRIDVIKSVGGFLLGIFPFLFYDISHKFVQTIGFPIWILNRTRLFFGLTTSGNSTTMQAKGALVTVWEQVNRIVFPQSEIVVIAFLISVLIIFWLRRNLFFNKKSIGLILVFLWIVVPLFGFVIHAAPGTAYFPLVFPAVSLLAGYVFYQIFSKFKLAVIIFFIIILYNAFFIINNEYFLTTKNRRNTLPPGAYSFGHDFQTLNEVSSFLVKDAGGRRFKIKGGGFLSKFQTSVDNYIYLSWWKGGNLSEEPSLIYIIYENKEDVPKTEKIIYEDGLISLTKDEK